MDQRQRRVWLIGQLLREYPEYQDADEADLPIPHDDEEQRLLLRALQNVRPPAPVSERFLHVQDEYLGAVLAQRAITDTDDVLPIETIVPAGINVQRAWPASPVRNGQPSQTPQTPQTQQTQQTPQTGATLAIWQGDITTLRCDAIVNAANSGLTGCYAPNHHCIDNAIHTAAGVQLRLACDRIMEQQGHPEPVGHAKITPGFNLPARYVLHTVGPMIPSGDPTPAEQEQLADCYRSCLRLAADHGLETIAFCSISTGEFRFPAELAARIAVHTVRDFLTQRCAQEFPQQEVAQSQQTQSQQTQSQQTSTNATAAPIASTPASPANTADTANTPSTIRKVIFDVFSDRDRQIYERVFADHA
ncbi:macro domain-containing protein [Bifidobacterium sp.]|uniref:macro domain-containing protein n=1 Tax=Bifidobacterium sp. TaxID=41200 RepID=UPI003D7CBDC9